MCGRYALTSPPAVIAERFHLLWTPEVAPHYNIAPSQTIPVVRETGQGRALALSRCPPSSPQYLSRLFSILLAAVVLGMLFTGGGLALSHGPDLLAGSTIILVAGVTYLCSLVAGRLLRRTGFRPRKRPAR